MAEPQLKRLLGSGFAVAVLVGGIFGLGILRTPGEIAAVITDPWIYMALWAGGGAFVLLNLAVVAELISMTPRSGGTYALIARAYGPYPGFLIGWVDWISFPAVLALKAVVIIEYGTLVLPALEGYEVPGAIIITSGFALLQLLGVRVGGGVQRLAGAGIGLIALGIAGALIYGGLSGAVEATATVAGAAVPLAAYGLVASSIIFTYDGWTYATYFGGEISGGGRMTAISSLKGLAIVTVLYLAINAALVMAVPLDAIAGHELALAGALELLFGTGAGIVLIGAALFILLSQQNLDYLGGPRILHALSVDGLGTRRATHVSDKGTPTGALMFTWALTLVLILIGGFNFLLGLSALLYLISYMSMLLGVHLLRRKEPETERPFRALGHPWLGIFCFVGWLALAIFIAVSDPMTAVDTLGLIAVSAPAYWLIKRNRETP